MKKIHFVFIAISVLSLPIIVSGVVYLLLSKNIFDNPDFWYGYMAYFGTACLAIVSLWQNENANKINNRLNKLQENEFTPTLLITGFLGISNLKVTFNDLKNKNDIFITEMRSKDDDIKLGYAVCLIDNDFSQDTSCIPRIYEIHLKSVNKSLITEMEIKNISFRGGNFQKDYSINRNIDVSINNNDEFILFIYHFSDTYKDTKNKALFSLCRKMKFKIQIHTSLNKVFEENISVDKHFIEKGFKEYPEGNIELMISSSFEIKEISKDK